MLKQIFENIKKHVNENRFGIQTIQLKNPLSERLEFRVLVSNTDHFSIENKQHAEVVCVEADSAVDVNIKFMPSTIGLADHVGIISFHNERIGNISYEVRGIGLEPDTQDPINITSEVNQTQMVTVYFKNTTDSAIYCDLALVTDSGALFEDANTEAPVFNLLLNSLDNIHMPPKASLDIPIVFSPVELRSYNVNLVVSARREARMSWNEKETR
jgi:hypothetical protein